jgi:biopolymer transport protein ExbB
VIELIRAGGWLMLPILLCSVVATAIIIERAIALRRTRVMPPRLVHALRIASQGSSVNAVEGLMRLSSASPLGRILRAGIANYYLGRDAVKESLEDAGRQVVHELELHLNALGTIAAITPLLGLLGTVIGMIEVFNVISQQGTGNAELLADGISKALVTTAGGLSIAIPSLLFYRYFRGLVDELIIKIEEEALRLVDLVGLLAMNAGKLQEVSDIARDQEAYPEDYPDIQPMEQRDFPTAKPAFRPQTPRSER